ncbi:MAG: hypothetical protein R3E79_19065 [Caldilineaceae bacterium]
MLRTSVIKEDQRLEQSLGKATVLPAQRSLRDYVALTKPRVISLLLAITLVPMFLAGSTAPSPLLIF